MKPSFLAATLAIVAVCGVTLAPVFGRMLINAQRAHEAAGVPQTQRILRVPSAQVLNAVLPGEARQVLERSASLTLFSLDPYNDGARSLRGHAILGQATVGGAAKQAMVASVTDGLIEADGQTGAPTSCFFEPRHGLRATSGGHTLDLLICFKCRQLRVYQDGQQSKRDFSINAAPRPLLDGALTNAQIPLAR